MERFVIVSYDIKDNKRRVKAAKTLLDYGTRVQYSVFECILQDNALKKLTQKLQSIIKNDEDTVRFYTLCQNCRSIIQVYGTGVVTTDPDVYII